METKNGIKAFYAKTSKEWWQWLEKNCALEEKVFLIVYHQGSKTISVDVKEAVEQALCYGWIDSKALKRDEESFYLTFSPRNSKSKWSKINKARAQKMIDQGLMKKQGQAAIDHAKKTGAWDVDDDVIPEDLQKVFDKNKTAYKNFLAFAPSSRRLILGWILSAKRPETREKRILQTVELAKDNIKANHPK